MGNRRKEDKHISIRPQRRVNLDLHDLERIIDEHGEEIRQKQAIMTGLLEEKEDAMAVIQRSVADGTFKMEMNKTANCLIVYFTYEGDRYEYYDWDFGAEIAVYVGHVFWTAPFLKNDVFRRMIRSMWNEADPYM